MCSYNLLDMAKENLAIAVQIMESRMKQPSYLKYVAYHIEQSVEFALKYYIEKQDIVYFDVYGVDGLVKMVIHLGYKMSRKMRVVLQMVDTWKNVSATSKVSRAEIKEGLLAAGELIDVLLHTANSGKDLIRQGSAFDEYRI